MARTLDLATALSPIDGRSTDAIELYARRLREDGLLPNNGRGHRAPDIAGRNAVDLLIALHGADNPRGAGEYVRRFRNLVPYGLPETSKPFEAWPKAKVLAENLSKVETFGMALEILTLFYHVLHSWIVLPVFDPDEKVRAATAKAYPHVPAWQIPLISSSAGIRVKLKRLGDAPVGALIEIGHVQGRVENIDFMWEFRMGVAGLGTRDNPYPGDWDRSSTHQFGTRTLATVWETVCAGLDNDATDDEPSSNEKSA